MEEMLNSCRLIIGTAAGAFLGTMLANVFAAVLLWICTGMRSPESLRSRD
jgi:hypothetical protein